MQYKTVCNLCGRTGCGLLVTVEDGKITNVEGDKTHPESKGILCPKGRNVLDILYSSDRLMYPMMKIKKNGFESWELISWEQALSVISEKLFSIKRDYGAEAVWFHKGSGHDVCSGDIRGYLHRLANVFGSPNVSCPFYICYGPRTLNMYLMTGGIPAPDAENSDCIILWGINVSETAPTRHRKVLEALARGADVIVVDPRNTYFTDRSAYHLRLRPGTDGALALGMLNVIIREKIYDKKFVESYTTGFDELWNIVKEFTPERTSEITWIPSETIIKASRLYAKSPSSCIYLGNALDQHTGTSQAIRAITSLIAVTGNLDVPGGNVMISPLQLAKKPPENHSLLPKEQVDKQLGKEFLLSRFEFTRLCHPPTVYKAILDEKPYPLKAAFIMAANPALTSPNSNMVKRALKKLDFFVVTDLFMTETAKLADIVLPASTFLEQTYYATYQPATDILPENPGLVMLRPQIISPLYKSRSDWDIISALAKKMGYEEHFEWKNIEEAIDEELSYTGITVEQLKKHPEGIPIEGPSFLYAKFGEKGVFGKLMIKLLNKFKFSDYPWVYRKYEKIGFQTDSGKVELVSKQFKNLGLDVLPIYHEPIHSPCNTDQAEEYPLILTTGAKTRWFVHSQMRNIAKLGNEMPKNFMEINPKTARQYDVTDGEEVIVTSPNGSMNVMTKFTDKILQDVVQIYHGFSKSNINCITNNQSFDPVTGSTPLRSSLCRVDKIENL